MPRPQHVYVVGGFAFVPHPLLAALWIRTDPAVVKVACDYPGCGSPINIPCRRTGPRTNPATVEYYSGTHYSRRALARKLDFPKADEIRMTIRTTARTR